MTADEELAASLQVRACNPLEPHGPAGRSVDITHTHFGSTPIERPAAGVQLKADYDHYGELPEAPRGWVAVSCNDRLVFVLNSEKG